jgi:hypothetical protein
VLHAQAFGLACSAAELICATVEADPGQNGRALVEHVIVAQGECLLRWAYRCDRQPDLDLKYTEGQRIILTIVLGSCA